LQSADIAVPEDAWDVTIFESVLRQLEEYGYPALEAPRGIGDILMLATSYGGLPIEISATDSTLVNFNLTESTTVSAIREVLDLAREGLMAYHSLSSGEPYSVTFGLDGPAVYFSEGSFSEVVIRDIPYPFGNVYAPIAFDITGFFISADALYPEACYRLYSFLRERYDILNGIPAVRTTIKDPALAIFVGQDMLTSYRAFAKRLDSSNAIILPTRLDSIVFASGYSQIWIAQAFDAYVLENADLETVLTEAQSKIDAFNVCFAEVEPFEFTLATTPEQFQNYQEDIQACAAAVDPTIATNSDN